MQDGYYFATSPWLIGDTAAKAADDSGITMVEDQSGLRRGQIVRIAAEPQFKDDCADLPAAEAPVILRDCDRSDAVLALTVPQGFADVRPTAETDFSTLVAAMTDRQNSALAQIEQVFRHSVAQLEDRVVAALAANLELSRPQSAQNDRLDATLISLAQDSLAQGETMQNLGQSVQLLAARIDAIPPQSEALLRDVADIRAGLTELRVQARMIEMQLFAISRGTDNPLARPMGIEPLGAMLADTYAS